MNDLTITFGKHILPKHFLHLKRRFSSNPLIRTLQIGEFAEDCRDVNKTKGSFEGP